MRSKLYFNWLERRRFFSGRLPFCEYCGAGIHFELAPWETKATIDHRVPVSRGGRFDDPGNLAAACMRCNQEKGEKTAEEWMRDLAAEARQLPLPGLEAWAPDRRAAARV